MLVSHRQKFIYTKTIKTAGTSVEAYFEPWCLPANDAAIREHRVAWEGPEGIVGYRGPDPGDSAWVNHMSAAAIRSRLGDDLWACYFKFCVVRNPYDVLVSMYYFELRKGMFDPPAGEDAVAGFRAWLARGIPLLGRAQYMIDDQFCLDFYIRFEDLASGIRHVCDVLGLPFEAERLPRFKAGLRDHSIPLTEYYSEEDRQRVAQTYAPELEAFGYSAPG